MTDKSNSTAAARPQRIPLHNRNVIAVKNQDPNYSYRYVNINLERDPDRVQRFLEAGWEPVPQSKAGQLGDKRVDNPSAPGSTAEISVGAGIKAILMRIPKEYKLEDDAAKQAAIDEVENTMKAPADYGTLEYRTANSKI